MGCSASKNNSVVENKQPESLPKTDIKEVEKKPSVPIIVQKISQFVKPNAGFVIKTKLLATKKKVFINMFHHESVLNFISTQSQPSLDKKKSECTTYSIVIPTSLFQNCSDNKEIKNEVIYIILILC
jgi:hypothetical protein